ncbi:hypothetical protein PGT21_031188 [Puccinia graminis f. sp. tritici]|uniref:Rho-GAP domain-containing protein n=1 Tax=Puccinia graminis f. sp. tritici TaxID=56615 RepID=A0A5B0QUE3_PUCGR|nr:hypothetical protein PGT21_031188 [Puccinia graminis f. sp. tritici]KAA1116800.1 hypothetical protein PGTUg99_020748 [Puccinia graminis f. sp. tritici]
MTQDNSFSTASSSSSQSATSTTSTTSTSSSTDSSSNSSSSSTQQNQLIHKIIYSAGLDHQSNPLLVISASSFPAKLPAHLDFDSLTQQALNKFSPIISNGPYSLIIFASPAEHAPTVKQILLSYRLLSRPIRKNLSTLWVVHPTFWAKTTVQVLLKTIVSWKMSRKIKWIKDLSTLASLVPIHQVCIPPEVYKYDLTIEPSIVVPPSSRKPPVFKVSLEELMGLDGQDGIPQVIQDCANCIRSSAMKCEGLFRRPPSLTTTQIIRDAYDRRQPVKMEDYSDGPFLAASLIKLFLRELPEPIFSDDFYPLFRACPSIFAQPIIISHQDQSSLNTHNQAVLEYLQEHVLKSLKPKSAYILFDYVLKLCHDLALQSEHNKMDSHNLATCLAPTMIRSSDLISDAMMCKLPSPSSMRDSPDLGNQDTNEPTSFTSILKFMISCYPLLFDEPQEPASPVCSSISSSPMFKGGHLTMDPLQSSFGQPPSEILPAADDPSGLLQKLFAVRRSVDTYLPLRCTISHVGLSHAFSLADRPRSRLLQAPSSVGCTESSRDQKLKFATLQAAKTKNSLGYPLLSSAFLALPPPLSPSCSSESSNFFSSTSVTTTTTAASHLQSVPSLTHPSSSDHHHRQFTHSSDLNELD